METAGGNGDRAPGPRQQRGTCGGCRGWRLHRDFTGKCMIQKHSGINEAPTWLKGEWPGRGCILPLTTSPRLRKRRPYRNKGRESPSRLGGQGSCREGSSLDYD